MKGFDYASIDSYILKNQKNMEIDKVKPPKCAGCALSAGCAGVRSQYLDLYGAGELRPVLRHPRPASRVKPAIEPTPADD